MQKIGKCKCCYHCHHLHSRKKQPKCVFVFCFAALQNSYKYVDTKNLLMIVNFYISLCYLFLFAYSASHLERDYCYIFSQATSIDHIGFVTLNTQRTKKMVKIK